MKLTDRNFDEDCLFFQVLRLDKKRDRMNSRELNVNVPLAAGEEDFDDFEFSELQSAASPRPSGAVSVEGGLDCISGSLEDLVANFDEQLTVCFGDFKEQVDKIAPVQVNYLSIHCCQAKGPNLKSSNLKAKGLDFG